MGVYIIDTLGTDPCGLYLAYHNIPPLIKFFVDNYMFERKKWIGPKQIDTAEPMEDRKDADGNPLIRVAYIQGGVEYFTSKMLTAIVSDKTCDLTELRLKRVHQIVQEILKVMSVYGFKPHSEFEFLYATLKGTLDQRLKQASDFLWGVDDQELSFLDMIQVLEQRDKTIKDAKSAEKTGN